METFCTLYRVLLVHMLTPLLSLGNGGLRSGGEDSLRSGGSPEKDTENAECLVGRTFDRAFKSCALALPRVELSSDESAQFGKNAAKDTPNAKTTTRGNTSARACCDAIGWTERRPLPSREAVVSTLERVGIVYTV